MENEVESRLAERIRRRWRKFNRRFAEAAAEALEQFSAGRDREDMEDSIREFIEWVEAAPNFVLLLVNLMADDRAPSYGKLRIAVLLLYLLSPVDFLPGWLLGPVGYMDDAVVALYLAFMILRWLDETDEGVIHENWPGEPEKLEKIMKVVRRVSRLGGAGETVENIAEPGWRRRIAE
ncbi:MAG: YkvA family protein [bacterium]